MKKRIISILCVLALCLTLLPVGAFAQDAADQSTANQGTEMIAFDNDAASVEVGKTTTLTYTVNTDTYAVVPDTFAWSTSDATVATVDNGVVTGIKAGTAEIRLQAMFETYGIAYDTCVVTVTAAGTPGGNPGGGSTGGSTVTNPDGSTTTTVTNADGSVVETTVYPDGSKKIEVTTKDGSSSVTTIDANGKIDAQVTLSAAAVSNAQANGQPVVLPMESLPVSTDRANAPTVTLTLPADGTLPVIIPVASVTAGTVAILVAEDGTEKVIKTSIPTEAGIALTMSNGDTVKVVDNSKDFADVASNFWGADAIDFATSRELFNGTGDNAFSPNNAMTRAMFATVLARFAGVDTSVGSTWYEAGVQWAINAGISDGTNLNSGITREQLITMLWRYMGSPEVNGNVDAFADAGSISAYAQQAMNWAVGTGLITGMGNNTINPQGDATRAQVATILMRFVSSSAN